MGTLKVIAPDDEADHEPVWSKTGDQVEASTREAATNKGWLFSDTLLIDAPTFRFEGIRGSSWKGDMAVAAVRQD